MDPQHLLVYSALHTCRWTTEMNLKYALLLIRIRTFLGLLDPNPLVRGTDPDPSIIKQK
jgi:hypothetical protein